MRRKLVALGLICCLTGGLVYAANTPIEWTGPSSVSAPLNQNFPVTYTFTDYDDPTYDSPNYI